MRRLPLLLSSSFALTLACGGDKGSTTTSTVDVTSGTGEEGGEGDEAGAFTPIPARGINITKITTNQGTEVEISENGVWVDGANRRTFIVSDRDTLIRVHFTVDEGWVERVIEARLYLTLPDATEQEMYYAFNVRQDSNERFLDRTFFFGLVGDEGQVQPGTQFRVELWETAAGGEGFEEHRWQSPEAGPAFIGIQPEPMEMNVMFVPIIWNGSPPDMSEDDRQHVENRVLEHNALQRVNAQWHDPYPYNGSLNSLGNLLPVMSSLRSAEGFGFSSLYYVAVIETGGGGVDGAAGIAWVVTDDPGADRVNANVWWQTGSSADTIVHEIGHNQGLSHIFCQGGGAAGPDPSYPDPNGYIMNPGFEIRNFGMHPPEHFDYMSYCGPSFVSDWTWTKTYHRIKTLTSWGDPFIVPNTPILKGMVYEDGTTEWWTIDGSVNPEEYSGNHTITFDTGDSEVESMATMGLLTDGKTQWLATPVPEEVEITEVRGIRYDGDRVQGIEIDRGAINLAHTQR